MSITSVFVRVIRDVTDVTSYTMEGHSQINVTKFIAFPDFRLISLFSSLIPVFRLSFSPTEALPSCSLVLTLLTEKVRSDGQKIVIFTSRCGC